MFVYLFIYIYWKFISAKQEKQINLIIYGKLTVERSQTETLILLICHFHSIVQIFKL